MLTALNKIVINTARTASNIRALKAQGQADGSLAGTLDGMLAAGGWITGGIPGRDSVPLASGHHIGMPDEFVVQRAIAQRDRAWLPAYNAGLINPFANDNYARASNVVSFPTPVLPSFAGRGTDNSALIASLIKRIDQLEQTLAGVFIAKGGEIVRAVRETSADEIEAAEDNAKRHAFALTQNAKDNKAA